MSGEVREKIIEGTIAACRKKGLKFTMDDVAGELSMSKKTIYTVFSDKVSLMDAMVDYIFERVKEDQNKVVSDSSLDITEKMKRILTTMPEIFSGIEFSEMYILKDKHPKLYEKVTKHLKSGWDTTFDILDCGIAEGVFRRIDHPVFEMIYEASLERFLSSDGLFNNNISYTSAQKQLVDILIFGIKIRDYS
ncbi:MAG: TetR/AcrR family transcriptional regulator [Lachnospiraceae bacterium]|nr:TetR/AcrR family transcriptional regulator [Lachnospiraceae bacterium]